MILALLCLPSRSTSSSRNAGKYNANLKWRCPSYVMINKIDSIIYWSAGHLRELSVIGIKKIPRLKWETAEIPAHRTLVKRPVDKAIHGRETSRLQCWKWKVWSTLRRFVTSLRLPLRTEKPTTEDARYSTKLLLHEEKVMVLPDNSGETSTKEGVLCHETEKYADSADTWIWSQDIFYLSLIICKYLPCDRRSTNGGFTRFTRCYKKWTITGMIP